MAIPNPLPDPEDHGEVLGGGNDAAREHEQSVLDRYAADMTGTTAAKLAAQLVPVVPDGGNIGRTAKPVVDRVTRARDWARIWGPAVAGTAVAGTAVAVLPLPGPLAVYVLAIAAFGWWHCAGRPGVTETVQMIGYALADTGSWIRRHVETLAVRRARYETRRTTNNPKKEK
ncbi:hypothetical protein [Nocardia ignorata]|uniref:Uncharacterized protein n=1 Tax=Nocardia ignorata TaxID=145285 RepID=A0A4V3CPS5_NOCIG|nr:hypothetical protein [Nocardia ignorata]TDP38752.1 hypothetical protein DFR75_103409 [Nocardia ignorata]